MQLTEKDLPDLAGWQTVKSARTLVSAGSVLNAKVEMSTGEPCQIQGVVAEGRRRHVSGLTVYSLSEAKNHCSCLAARRHGQICDHSIAVALVALSNQQVLATKQTSETNDPLDDEGASHLIPAPLFNYEKIDKRSIFPIQLVSYEKPPISREIHTGLLSRLSKLGITLPGDTKPVELNKSGFLQVLGAFKGAIWPGYQQQWPPTRVSSISSRIPLKLTQINDNLDTVRIEIPPLNDSAFLFDGFDCWILRYADHLSIPTKFTELPPSCRTALSPLLQSFPDSSCIEVERRWLQNELPYLADVFHMECSEQLNESLRGKFGTPKVSLHIEGSLRQLELRLIFTYQPEELPNPGFAAKTFRQLNVINWSQGKPAADGFREYYQGKLNGEEPIMDFYAGTLDRLIRTDEWDVQIGQRFAQITKDIEKVRPRVTESGQGNDWLSFDLEFSSTKGQCVPEKEIRRLLATGSNRIRLKGGGRAVFDSAAAEELFDAFRDAEADAVVNYPSRRKVKSSHKLFIESEIQDLSSTPLTDSLTLGEVKPPSCFDGELRNYQLSALSWLYRRTSLEHGAILADEMGLGKTIQILALIALIQQNLEENPSNQDNNEVTDACIIVCPTSLIFNWKREIRRFLPTKSLLVLHGPGRTRNFKKIPDFQIVITSYGSITRDIEKYPDLCFQLAVADEASCLKNPKTQIAKSMSMLCARSKIALSGTPMENSVKDLWSIMDFSNPGYLENMESFISRYGSSDQNQMKRLHKRIAPFMLRRTKAEVATELPSKIERVVYCELTSDQRRYYEQLLNFGRNSFKNIGKSLSESNKRMEVLLLVLRLRQICCDLRLLDPGKSADLNTLDATEPKSLLSTVLGDEDLPRSPQASSATSAKLIALDGLLEGLISSGGKVLIFSQFVSMLKLIRENLDSRGHDYCYLDGSQSPEQRNQQVEAFQSAKSKTPIFLMSLKAGGYGLTLTQADTVIHFDPWWNPAVEAQATDRAHRIGQDKTVTSYKLIVTGSVEEKILQLQDRKRHMAGVALDEENPLMESLSGEDIEFLLN